MQRGICHSVLKGYIASTITANGESTLRHFILLFCLLTIVFLPLAAQSKEPDSYVKVRLLAERTNVKGGDEILIGTEQSIYRGWHTYWKNPGDSGSVPDIQWELPDGAQVGGVMWPAPYKLPYGPLLNYGYSGSVILLQSLKLPETIPDGPLILVADVEVLVCKDVCIPEFGSYELVLNDPQRPEENNSEYLKAAAQKLPQDVLWDATFEESAEGEEFVMSVTPGDPSVFEGLTAKNVAFYPEEWGLVNNAAPAAIEINNGTIVWRQPRGDRKLSALESAYFVMVRQQSDGIRTSYRLMAHNPAAIRAAEAALLAKENTPSTAAGQTTIFTALVLALLGGVILNLMPCVFPVLSIKALSLVKISKKSPKLARRHGWAYTLGILASFGVIAGLLIAFKAAGAQIGWGFQLQNPLVVGGLAYLLFLIGLNLLGFFDVKTSFGNVGSKLAQGDGLTNSFFMGVLATLVATPCTAPFMAAAIGYALVQPALVAMLVFLTLGFGLALPYLALAHIPKWHKKLPKPGVWMERFRQFLAFPMFASAAWLVWVLSQQAGAIGTLMILMGIIALGFALWLLRISTAKNAHRMILSVMAAVALIVALVLIPSKTVMKEPGAVQEDAAAFGEVFSHEKLDSYLAGKDPVFVEMTAAWCITCKVNHAVALNKQGTKDLFAQNSVKYLVGDWTNQDPEITRYLNEFNRSGVPVYVYYAAPDGTGKRPDPEVLPQILTPDIVRSAVEGE